MPTIQMLDLIATEAPHPDRDFIDAKGDSSADGCGAYLAEGQIRSTVFCSTVAAFEVWSSMPPAPAEGPATASDQQGSDKRYTSDWPATQPIVAPRAARRGRRHRHRTADDGDTPLQSRESVTSRGNNNPDAAETVRSPASMPAPQTARFSGRADELRSRPSLHAISIAILTTQISESRCRRSARHCGQPFEHDGVGGGRTRPRDHSDEACDSPCGA